MGILAWIILGLIVGVLAGLLVKGSGYGIIGDIILGIIGAVVGGFIAGAVFGIPNAVNGINLESIIVALIGAIIVIVIYRALVGHRRTV